MELHVKESGGSALGSVVLHVEISRTVQMENFDKRLGLLLYLVN